MSSGNRQNQIRRKQTKLSTRIIQQQLRKQGLQDHNNIHIDYDEYKNNKHQNHETQPELTNLKDGRTNNVTKKSIKIESSLVKISEETPHQQEDSARDQYHFSQNQQNRQSLIKSSTKDIIFTITNDDSQQVIKIKNKNTTSSSQSKQQQKGIQQIKNQVTIGGQNKSRNQNKIPRPSHTQNINTQNNSSLDFTQEQLPNLQRPQQIYATQGIPDLKGNEGYSSKLGDLSGDNLQAKQNHNNMRYQSNSLNRAETQKYIKHQNLTESYQPISQDSYVSSANEDQFGGNSQNFVNFTDQKNQNYTNNHQTNSIQQSTSKQILQELYHRNQNASHSPQFAQNLAKLPPLEVNQNSQQESNSRFVKMYGSPQTAKNVNMFQPNLKMKQGVKKLQNANQMMNIQTDHSYQNHPSMFDNNLSPQDDNQQISRVSPLQSVKIGKPPMYKSKDGTNNLNFSAQQSPQQIQKFDQKVNQTLTSTQGSENKMREDLKVYFTSSIKNFNYSHFLYDLKNINQNNSQEFKNQNDSRLDETTLSKMRQTANINAKEQINLQNELSQQEKQENLGRDALKTPKNQQNILQIEIVQESQLNNLTQQYHDNLKSFEFQQQIFLYDIPFKQPKILRQKIDPKKRRIFKNQVSFTQMCLDIFRDLLQVNQNRILIRVVKRKIFNIAMDSYNKYIDEKDREAALAMYKRNFSKQQMNAFQNPISKNQQSNNDRSYLIDQSLQTSNSNSKILENTSTIQKQKQKKVVRLPHVEEKDQLNGTGLNISRVKGEKMLTPILEYDDQEMKSKQNKFVIKVTEAQQFKDQNKPLSDDDLSSIKRQQNQPRISNSSTGSNFIDNLMFQLKKKKDPEQPHSAQNIQKMSAGSDCSAISPMMHEKLNNVIQKQATVVSDLKILNEVSSTQPKRKSFNIIEDKFEESFEEAKMNIIMQQSDPSTQKQNNSENKDQSFQSESHMSIYDDETDEKEQRQIAQKHHKDEISSSSDEGYQNQSQINHDKDFEEQKDKIYDEFQKDQPQTFRIINEQDDGDLSENIHYEEGDIQQSNRKSRNKVQLTVQTHKLNPSRTLNKITLDTSALRLDFHTVQPSPMLINKEKYATNDLFRSDFVNTPMNASQNISQGFFKQNSNVKSTGVSPIRNYKVNPITKQNVGQIGLPFAKGLTMNAQKRPSILSGKSGVSIFTSKKRQDGQQSNIEAVVIDGQKQEIKGLVNRIQDLDVERQQQIIKALKPHINQASQNGSELKLRSYANLVKQATMKSQNNQMNTSVVQQNTQNHELKKKTTQHLKLIQQKASQLTNSSGNSQNSKNHR
eukprot:403368380